VFFCLAIGELLIANCCGHLTHPEKLF
jgi:hypothetical protein